MEAEGKKSLRDFLLVRELKSLALASASRFAGSPHAARNPCYAPRPEGSIPSAVGVNEKKPSIGRFFY
jgi:hypothetical protein